MKLCILGASGNCGQRLLSAAVMGGHTVTAIVRDPAKLAGIIDGEFATRAVDFDDADDLHDAIKGHDVAINAAGYISDTVGFVPLVKRIIAASDRALGPDGRFWMFAGAALMDVPGSSTMSMDLPGFPPVFAAHRENYQAVLATRLDWSVLCPGPMIDSPDGLATPDLIVSSQEWPINNLAASQSPAGIEAALAFRDNLPRLTIYYEDAASVILENLERGGRYSRKRVGVGLPDGMTREKPGYTTQPKENPEAGKV